MVQRLPLLLLLTGAVPLILSVPRKYRLIQQGETWSDAQAYCRDKYTDLAVIDSEEDMVQFQNEAQQSSSDAWIGLYTNINNWYWSSGEEPLGSFTSWGSSEPNNLFADEKCVLIAGGMWYDAPCDWLCNFVCFDDSKSGTDRYVFINHAKTWYDAQSYCRETYTDLAGARDASENSIVAGKNYWYWTWFGLTRQSWKWSDQTTDVSLIKWLVGDANDYSKNKSCGLFSNGHADVAQCSNKMPFYCYVYPDQKQIVKIKVKSSQEVNDPTIMDAMLEKIKQKLEDYGMPENTTVKWRKQQDGMVFHKLEEHNALVVNNTRGSCDL